MNLTITAGGGSSGSLTSSSESYKGLKATSYIYITGGTFNINSKDDCIHSNGTITISGGTHTLSSGDDGVYADTDLAISGSATKLTINKSYEGIEATNVVITGGTISLVATDDRINAAGGNNSSSTPGNKRPGMGSFSSSNGSIKILGGTIYIKMSGDGIDANGTLSITAEVLPCPALTAATPPSLTLTAREPSAAVPLSTLVLQVWHRILVRLLRRELL